MFVNFNESHHHHVSFMQLGHLLTRSGLTYLEVSSKVCHDSFCQLGNSEWISVSYIIIYYIILYYYSLRRGNQNTFVFALKMSLNKQLNLISVSLCVKNIIFIVLFLNFIFGRASDLYLCLYNQLFALFHCVFKFLTTLKL